MENDEKLDKLKSIYFSNQEDYNKIMNKGGNPYHAKDGKFASAPSGGISSAKERYEKATSLYENIDGPRKGSSEEKEYQDAKKDYRRALHDSIQEKRKEIDELQQEYENLYWEAERFDKEGEQYDSAGNGEEAVLAYEEAERIRTADMKKVSDKVEKIESEYSSLKKELSLLDESPSERFEREKFESTPSLSEAEKAHLEKLKEERKDLYKKIDAITKTFGNSISKQIQDNSIRLTTILNAQSKGNPYHDKEGKFCSGPGAAFGAFGEHGGFSRNEAARYLQLYRSGEQDIVTTRMNDDNLIASAECAKAASQMYDDAYNLSDRFGEDAEKFSSVKKAKDINHQLLNLGYQVNKTVKKYAQSNDKALLSKLKSYSDRAEKLSKSASLLEKQKKSAVENNSAAQTAIAYAKLAGEAVPAIYSTMNYIDKNLEKEPRHFATK